jgi:hypothetical protein
VFHHARPIVLHVHASCRMCFTSACCTQNTQHLLGSPSILIVLVIKPQKSFEHVTEAVQNGHAVRGHKHMPNWRPFKNTARHESPAQIAASARGPEATEHPAAVHPWTAAASDMSNVCSHCRTTESTTTVHSTKRLHALLIFSNVATTGAVPRCHHALSVSHSTRNMLVGFNRRQPLPEFDRGQHIALVAFNVGRAYSSRKK